MRSRPEVSFQSESYIRFETVATSFGQHIGAQSSIAATTGSNILTDEGVDGSEIALLGNVVNSFTINGLKERSNPLNAALTSVDTVLNADAPAVDENIVSGQWPVYHPVSKVLIALYTLATDLTAQASTLASTTESVGGVVAGLGAVVRPSLHVSSKMINVTDS